jgi:hypothetical protein
MQDAIRDTGMAIADLLSCAPHFLEALFQACTEGKGDMAIDY